MKKYFTGITCILSLYAMGQENNSEYSETEIDGVTIIRTAKEKEQALIAVNGQPTSLLTTKDLNRNNPAFVEKAFNTISGAQMEKRTNVGGHKITLRGYGNDQRFNNWGVKVYLNNVPLTNADGMTILEDIDFSQLTSLEVIKGPASTRFGGGVGGVVQFFMEPRKQNGTSISEKLILGSFNHFQSLSNFSSKSDKASVSLSYNHLETDGYRPWNKSLRNNYAFLGDFKVNENQSIEVYAAHNNSYEQVAGQISYDDYYAGIDPGNTAYINRGSGNKMVSNRAFISHHWKMANGLNNATSLFVDHLDTKRIAAGAYEKSGSINYGLRSVFDYTKKWSDDFDTKTELGVEYMTSSTLISNYRFSKSATNPLDLRPIDKGSYLDYKNINYSIFATEKITYNPWKASLILGLSANQTKYDRQDLLALEGLLPNYNKDLSFSKKYNTAYTPHIVLQKKWNTHLFNLSYSEGYNSPTAGYSLGSATSASDANDELQVEKARMWDFTSQGLLLNNLFDYQVSLFTMKVKNKITPFKTPDYTYYINGGNQNHKGLEASLGYSYGHLGFFSNVRAFATYAFYDFKYSDFVVSSVNYEGNRVAGVPKNQYSFGLDLETEFGLYLNNTFTYKGDVYADFGNTNFVKGFGLYNAKIGYQRSLGKLDVDVYLAGNNLTNQINYTFLFTGNAQKNGDDNSNYENVLTDITPGYNKAYYFYGINLKYNFK